MRDRFRRGDDTRDNEPKIRRSIHDRENVQRRCVIAPHRITPRITPANEEATQTAVRSPSFGGQNLMWIS